MDLGNGSVHRARFSGRMPLGRPSSSAAQAQGPRRRRLRENMASRGSGGKGGSRLHSNMWGPLPGSLTYGRLPSPARNRGGRSLVGGRLPAALTTSRGARPTGVLRGPGRIHSWVAPSPRSAESGRASTAVDEDDGDGVSGPTGYECRGRRGGKSRHVHGVSQWRNEGRRRPCLR